MWRVHQALLQWAECMQHASPQQQQSRPQHQQARPPPTPCRSQQQPRTVSRAALSCTRSREGSAATRVASSEMPADRSCCTTALIAATCTIAAVAS